MLEPLLIAAPLAKSLHDALLDRYQCYDICQQPELLATAEARTARALVGTGGTVVTQSLLDQCPALEIVSLCGVGYDGVDLAACAARGVAVTNTPDVLTDDVADLAVALVIMTSRGLIYANRALHEDNWNAGAYKLTQKASGKRAGIVGLGRIGKAIAQRLAAMKMDIAYYGRRQQPEVSYRYEPSLVQLATWSDFLILICPGGPGTHHLVNAEVLAALGQKGILINVARGAVVDEAALCAAVQQRQLGGIGLDVYEHEPAVPQVLKDWPQAVLLPHVGSATVETRQAMAQLVLDNLAAHFSQQPLLTQVTR
jgi:hydroxypyruvate reductase